jgi:hypothetical protein
MPPATGATPPIPEDVSSNAGFLQVPLATASREFDRRSKRLVWTSRSAAAQDLLLSRCRPLSEMQVQGEGDPDRRRPRDPVARNFHFDPRSGEGVEPSSAIRRAPPVLKTGRATGPGPLQVLHGHIDRARLTRNQVTHHDARHLTNTVGGHRDQQTA